MSKKQVKAKNSKNWVVVIVAIIAAAAIAVVALMLFVGGKNGRKSDAPQSIIINKVDNNVDSASENNGNTKTNNGTSSKSEKMDTTIDTLYVSQLDGYANVRSGRGT